MTRWPRYLFVGTFLFAGCDVFAPSESKLADIRIHGDQNTVHVNAQLALTASGFDAKGRSVTLHDLVWASSDQEVATVGGNGAVTGRRGGTAVITATASGIAGTFPLSVGGRIHRGGTVQTQTWSAADSPHIVQDIVYVLGSLTIEAGAEVRLARAASIETIGAGKLQVLGTADAPVLFRAHDDGPHPEPWGEIYLSEGSEMSHARLQDCGRQPAVRGCVLMTGEALVRNVEVSGSGADGIWAVNDGRFAPGSGRVTISEAAGYPLVLAPGAVHTIPDDLTLVANGQNAIHINAVGFSGAGVWRQFGVPYDVSGDLYVERDQTLTIQPGTQLRWLSGSSLHVVGKLIASGTPSEPIHLTSGRETPEPGDWVGVVMWEPSGSVLEHVITSYCAPYRHACLRLSGSERLQNVEVRHSGWTGIDAFGGFAPGSEEIFISGAVSYPLDISVSRLESIPATFRFADVGEEAILVRAGLIDSSLRWPYRDVPYDVVDGPIDVFGVDTNLTIEAGTVVRFGDNGSLGVHEGAMIAIGTPERPILFSTLDDRPEPGSWYGLHFSTGASDRNRLDHVIVEYGGGRNTGLEPWKGMVRIDVDLGEFITNSVIRQSFTCGIARGGNTTTDFLRPALNIQFAGNLHGDQC
jgi:hypothetical protein